VPPPFAVPLAGRRGRRRRRVAVLTAVPLVGLLLEPLPTLFVPRAGTMAVSAPAAGSPEDASDQEERSEQEQREQEEPGEEVRPAVADDVDDLDFLAVRLSDVDLLITDSGLSPDDAAVIERGGTEVVRA